MGGAIAYAYVRGWRGMALAVVALLTAVPASELTIQILQRIISDLIPPRRLPRLKLEQVPPDARTMVIVPTMLDSAADVANLLAHLEVQALGNVDPHIHFAVLSDFRDAATETLPQDDAILEAARAGIAALNEKHGQGRADRFFLFHRLRQWNQAEGRWMGWERKRGKIEEFNRLLRGATDTSFAVQMGDLSILGGVRYCITLDTDTALPRDAARELIGIIMHPLNQARFDATLGRVVEGYGILQPRISVTFMSAAGSLFARLYAGQYRCRSLYDGRVRHLPGSVQRGHIHRQGAVRRRRIHRGPRRLGTRERAAFPRSVRGLARTRRARVRRGARRRIPLERAHPRAPAASLDPRRLADLVVAVSVRAVATGIEAQYAAAHRPVEDPGQPPAQPRRTDAADPCGSRMDLAARFPMVLDDGSHRRARVTTVAGCGAAPDWPDEGAVGPGLSPQSVAGCHGGAGADACSVSCSWRFTRSTRPMRSVSPLSVWSPAGGCWSGKPQPPRPRKIAGLSRSKALQRFVSEMRSSPITAAGVGVAVAVTNAPALPAAAPFLLLWLVAPVVAYWLSVPVGPRVRPLSDAERMLLRRTARSTWRYFEAFTTAAEGWLPPDNYQEHEEGPRLARRTSPTNIGMGLLSTLAAHDLGYLTTDALVARLDGTLTTMEGLERYHGHFLNWYDTDTRAPLHPRYVSTVDSGNLAAALIALSQGLQLLTQQPQSYAQLCAGLADAADLLAAASASSTGAEDDRHTLTTINRLAGLIAADARGNAIESGPAASRGAGEPAGAGHSAARTA